MKRRALFLGLSAAAAVAAGGCEKKQVDAGKAGAAQRCSHEIKPDMCPFCNPEMVEREGFCGEHGVAEALCAQCRPYLKAAFKAKGDWCQEHAVPDSQCIVHHPELKEKVAPGEHGTGGNG